MKVKNIHLHGFKSFAASTQLEFDAGLAAVVGPNGSGKSNLVEAVRWVLGEQSPSQLRSKRTEDYIWAGGSGRAQAGMAEVSITFDNSDRTLPLPYDEVTISRRAYRSGENEYLINRSRVRLRDVSELTSAIGLGYAVVSQGTADAALSLTPEGRRSLFEEAADITQHYMRRDEAVRRIAEMEQNSTRVQDLLAELEPRLRALARQARQVRDQEAEQEKLRSLYTAYFAEKLRGLSAELTRAREQLDLTTQAHSDLAARIAERDRAEEVLRREEAEAAQAAQALESELAAAQMEATAAERRLILAEGEVARLGREMEGMRQRLSSATSGTKAYEQELAALSAAETDLLQRHEAATRRLEEVRAEQSRAVRVQTESSREVDKLRAQQLHDQEEAARARNRLTSLTDRLESLQHERERHARHNREHDERAAAVHAALVAAEQQHHSLQAAVEAAETHLDVLRRRARALDSDLPQARASVTEAEVQLKALRGRLALLQEMEHSGAGLPRSVQAVLRWSSEGRLSGIHGTLASLLEVPPRYEAAVESVLGGALQNIVVSEWAQAERAVQMLKSTGSGRTTFLPLDTLRPAARPRLPAVPGVIGLAVDLVAYPTAVQGALLHALGRVLIVDDLAAARAAVGQITGISAIVTLEGETVRPGGALTGGSAVRESGTLARHRELRDLPAAILEGERTVAAAAARVQSLQTERSKLESSERSAATDLREAQQQLQRGESQLRSAQREQNQLEQLQEWTSASERRLTDEIADIKRREDESRARLAELDAAARSSAVALSEAVAREAEVRRSVGAMNVEASRLQTEEAVLRERLEGERRRLQRVQELIRKSTLEMGTLAAEAQAVEQEHRAAERELWTVSQDAESVRAALASCRAAVAPLQARLSELREQQHRMEAARRRDADSLLRAEEARLAAGVAVERLVEQLEGVRGQARAQTGLDEIPLDAPVVDGIERQIRLAQERLARIGMVNPLAAQEYEDLRSRSEFLQRQLEDIRAAQNDLQSVISSLEHQMNDRFAETFSTVSDRFGEYFRRLFNGGSARLALVSRGESVGVEIQAQPPGKRLGSLALLSGGERALSSCALIFALIQTSRAPFSVLDEVDAALDESNVGRFCDLLEELGRETQFIVVTHNRGTIERAGRLYGISMEANGASRVLSLRLDDAEQVRASA